MLNKINKTMEPFPSELERSCGTNAPDLESIKSHEYVLIMFRNKTAKWVQMIDIVNNVDVFKFISILSSQIVKNNIVNGNISNITIEEIDTDTVIVCCLPISDDQIATFVKYNTCIQLSDICEEIQTLDMLNCLNPHTCSQIKLQLTAVIDYHIKYYTIDKLTPLVAKPCYLTKLKEYIGPTTISEEYALYVKKLSSTKYCALSKSASSEELDMVMYILQHICKDNICLIGILGLITKLNILLERI